MNRYQVRLEVADGYVWITTFHLLDGEWVEWLSARLDDAMRVPNVLYDIPCLAQSNARAEIEEAYNEIQRRKNRS